MNEINENEKDKYPDTSLHPPLPMLKAIRAHCLECSQGSAEVRRCMETMPHCPLIFYRFGKNPFKQKRNISPEHLDKLQAGLKNHRENVSDTEVPVQ